MTGETTAASAKSTEGSGNDRGLIRGALATRSVRKGDKGSGAPSHRRAPFALLAAFALALTVGLLSAAPAFAAPATLTTDPVVGPAFTSVHLTGSFEVTGLTAEEEQVIEEGEAEGTLGPPTCYAEFEYSKDGVNWETTVLPYPEQNPSSFPQTPCNPSPQVGVPQPVSETITGLSYGTEYHVRLAVYVGYRGEYFNSPAQVFTTQAEPANPPLLTTAAASQVAFTTAHLSGTVDPVGGNQTSGGDAIPIKWHFQYSTNPDEFGWTDGPGGEITGAEAEGNGPIPVSADPSGLENHAHYAYRLVASYGDVIATSPGPDRALDTLQVTPPTATFDSTSAITTSSAHFSGHVTPEAPGAAPQDAGFDTEWKFVCTPECPGLTGGTVAADNGSHEVSVDATGLEPGTDYQVTLEATNKGGTATATKTFPTTTLLATVTSTPGGSDGQGGYTLQGIVNPHNSNVTCTFEYGPNLPYVFEAPCSPDPSGFNKDKPVVVEAHVTGLTIGATYHAKLVVHNAAGSADGGDQIFIPTKAQPQNCPNEELRKENSSLALPECRAYEMISPPEKGGYPAHAFGLGEGSPTAVGYATLAGNIAGSGQGSIGQNYYVSRRTEHGWETIPGLNGADGSLFSGPQALHYPVVLPNFFAGSLLTSMWNIEPNEISFAHKRPWLRNPDGSFSALGEELLTDHNAEFPAFNGRAHFSLDLSHLLFDGTVDAGYGWLVYGPGVYEYVGTGNGAPTRVDLDNLGDPISECGAPGEGGRVAFNREISANGSASVFTVNGNKLCDSSKGPPADEIWARVGGIGGASYDVSESLCTRTAGDPGGACNAPSDPNFLSVSHDGSRVFFSTKQQLVNGDTDQTTDIYRCEMPSATPAPGKGGNPCAPLTEVSGAAGGAEVEQVLAMSEDGSTAYFIASGLLADNEDALGETAKAGGHNLYVWRQDAANPAGQTVFIGAFTDPTDVNEPNDPFHPHPYEGPQTTDDGRYFVFNTNNILVPTDTDESRDIYRYDAQTGELSRVSVNSFGTGGNGKFEPEIIAPFKLYNPASGAGGQPPAAYPHPAISNNGKVVFITAEPLAPIDGNEAPDTYLWTEGKTSLITTASVGSMEASGSIGYGSRNPNQAMIDKSGEGVYFTSAQELVPADSDEVGDLYVAQVDGGFKAPVTSSCSGEACQPAPSPKPASPNPPTVGGNGAGNFKPKHCAKGKALVKNKCVKKKPKKKHHKKGKSRPAANRGGAK